MADEGLKTIDEGLHHWLPPGASVADIFPVTLSEIVKGEGRFMGQCVQSLKCAMMLRGPLVQGLWLASPTVAPRR
jgi:hypothetical protein